MSATISAPSDSASAPPRRPVESRNPATGECWRRFDAAEPADVRAAVAMARSVQPDWQAVPLRERAALLRRVHDILFRRRWDAASLITRENGKPRVEAFAAEVVVSLDLANYFADNAPRLLAPRWRRAYGLAMWRKRVLVEPAPWGVIGIISPWNYPLMLGMGEVLPSIVAGNAVVLKPSEHTPSCGMFIGELFAEAGLPPGVLQVLPGDAVTGAAIADTTDKVFFTGGERGGRDVAVRCASRLVPAVLELGGSDAAIVLADADVGTAARGITWGRFSAAGQTCVAPKRVFVVGDVYDAFVAEIGRRVGQLKVGAGDDDETDVGPLISDAQTDALRAQLDDAVRRGATVSAAAPASDIVTRRGWVTPTVLTNVPPDARVLSEETFGPLLPIVRVRDEAEALRLANATSFGLSASVWSRDVRRATRLAGQIEAGTVMVNDSVSVAGMAGVAHGGMKHSGIGRTHGEDGLLERVRPHTTIVDPWAGWAQPWWFSYSKRLASRLDAFATLAHGRGLSRLRGLAGTIRLVLGR